MRTRLDYRHTLLQEMCVNNTLQAHALRLQARVPAAHGLARAAALTLMMYVDHMVQSHSIRLQARAPAANVCK